MTPDPVFYFIHVPKTAGTTFRTHIRNCMRRGEYVFVYQTQRPEFTSREGTRRWFRDLGTRRAERLRIAFGHAVFHGLHEELPGRPAAYVTFLREPVAQTLSRYHFGVRTLRSLDRLRNEKFARELTAAGRVVTLGEWLEANPRHQNFTFRCLYSHLFGVPHDRVPTGEEHLERLQERLATFRFVGLLEEEDDELFLYHELGIDRFFARQNVTRRKPPADPGEIERIRETHGHDLALYAWAREHNARFKREHPGFAEAVEEVRRRRAAQTRWQTAVNSLRAAVTSRLDRTSTVVSMAAARLLGWGKRPRSGSRSSPPPHG